jgi:hypothetical protein
MSFITSPPFDRGREMAFEVMGIDFNRTVPVKASDFPLALLPFLRVL